MKLTLYNTRTRKKEEFTPMFASEDGTVGFYSCGPTVYWHPHIGNMRAYVFNDLLKRVLRYNGIKVKHVMNYTDVGHLTSDADEGEDKIEKAAAKEGKSAKEITEYYIESFNDDIAALNIIFPDVTCKATEYIKEQIDLIKKLEEKGYTYVTSDGVYFDTAKFSRYADFGKLNIEGLEDGKRIDMGEKRNKTDFALWKFSEEPGKRQQEWDSPWGLGFPGWHTECCVMSSEHLGEQFDLHTGGEDHIQVHHTNEIAQMECAYDVSPWVNVWMHVAYLNFDGEKISKSKGGLLTIPEIVEKGFDPLAFRYFCLSSIYRKQTNFSMDALEASQASLNKLKNIVIELKKKADSDSNESNESEKVDEFKTAFLEAVNDDLNMPKALSVLWEALRSDEIGAKEKLELALDFDCILGLGVSDMQEEKIDVSEDVMSLLEKREAARKEKDYAAADKYRDEILAKGFVIKDTPEGAKLERKG